ncbi:hypothetical protein L208DRAFT_1383663 [Tricholoma matsutake]|nr:hypothetical protein L208DRAFT_1383663 [Tricholoma matsutake 945]
MPRGHKRQIASDSKDAASSPSKRMRKLSPDVERDAIVIDEDDDLDEILAQIKEQEESEKLALILQDEWNHPPASGDVVSSGSTTESDEALARRLAEEWGEQLDDDGDTTIGPSKLVERDQNSNAEKPGVQTGVQTGSSKPAQSSHCRSRTYSTSTEGGTPDTKLSEFRDLFTTNRECTKCGKVVKSPRGHVMFTNDSTPPSVTMLMHAPCSSCRTNHCRGCFTAISCPVSCKGASKNPKCIVMNCCAAGRAIAVFETLGGFDRQYIAEKATSDSRALAALAKMKSSISHSVGPGGTGYGTEFHTGGASHYGSYPPASGGSRPGSNNKKVVKSSLNDQLAMRWEEIIMRALNTLTELLPSPYAESAQAFDFLPHSSIGPLLSLSKLPELLDSLLRNDSVTDWISRGQTYHAMISLLRRMADCELTVQVLIEPRWEMANSPGLESWMWGEGDILWVKAKDNLVESSPPLYEHFEKLTKQCEAFLAGASQIMDASGDGNEEVEETMMQAASLCGDIIAAKGDMERVMSVLGVASSSDTGLSDTSGNNNEKGKNKDSSVELEKAYSAACEKLAFKHVMLGVDTGKKINYPNYNFATTLEQTQDRIRNAKDRLHLIKELAVMATSLPPGVWVRIDEVRNDAIKILIAGPEGTPYAGGLFEFDCFMPMEYPHTPPLMHLRTTGGGTVRFNPNLYNSGKVCLSLLGTWAGRPEEQWSSSRSTLLQVLVSIQSMIFIDAPYYNEPGYGKANVKAPESIAYNKEISMNTVRWAVVDWLNDAHRDSIWSDVITSHFRIRKEKIREKIVEWAANDSRLRSFPPAPRTWNNTLPAPSSEIKGLDLLEEFDLGMERITAWKTEEIQ